MVNRARPVKPFSSKLILERGISDSCSKWCRQLPCICHPIFVRLITQANLFFEYSTKRWDLQSVDILMSDKEVGRLDNASATTLFFPLTYSISKSYACTLLTHFCWHSFNSFCSKKYLRLLWSVLILNLLPTKYYLNFVKVCKIVRISLSYIE